ncbi:hypothetical protein Droror1_Dr00013658 [Drosera rotundifolia]
MIITALNGATDEKRVKDVPLGEVSSNSSQRLCGAWLDLGWPQLVPGMRPGAAPMPNILVPMMHHGQQGQRPMVRRGAGRASSTGTATIACDATGTLASALANASPEQQRMMLGENLYPLVVLIEHENAAKVSGMLLEMDQTEVLHLLESPDALKAKVVEAMKVLENAAQQQDYSQADQLAALSLN